VYESFKKECKERTVLWTCFFSVFDMGCDQAHRPDVSPDVVRLETDTAADSNDGKVFSRICSLATIIHDVGDLFSIEMVMPAPFWDHPALVKLLNLPGVYTFDYDASVQSSVRRRVWVICNHPFMAYACGETVRSLLPPERWAVLFTDFLIAC
jgi:hypothetical protein